MGITGSIVKMIKKDGLGKETYNPSHEMGIDILDYRNGWMEEDAVCLGVSEGKINTFIGPTGSGKSTLVEQLSWNIVKDEPNGQIIHIDFERAGNKARISKITGLPLEEISDQGEKYCYLNSDIFSETVYSLVKSINKIKLESYNDLKIKDSKGRYYLPPTVIIIDSIAAMTPENIVEEKELSGSMSASGIAKINNMIFKRINNIIGNSNITIMAINHITQKIEIGNVHTKPVLNFLGQAESVPGGSSALYLSDTLLKLSPGPKLDESKDFGIKGFYVVGEFLKSRSNIAGYRMNLIFDQANGFNNLLTNVNYLKENKLLEGSGQGGYYIPGYPDEKFRLKQATEKIMNNKKLKEKFDSFIKEQYTQFLSDIPLEDSLDLVKNIKDDIWEGSDGNYYHYKEKTGEIEECSKAEIIEIKAEK